MTCRPIPPRLGPSPTVTIQAEIFGFGYEVIVSPTQGEVGHDAEFRTAGEARDYAKNLAGSMGWRLEDLTIGRLP